MVEYREREGGWREGVGKREGKEEREEGGGGECHGIFKQLYDITSSGVESFWELFHHLKVK